MIYMLSIDPGVNAIGWCYWPTKGGKLQFPTQAGIIETPTKGTEWFQRILDVMEKLESRLGELRIDTLVCEEPILFGGAKGKAVAARGDLVHLGASMGACMEFARNRNAVFIPAPVNIWKGQLKKATVAKRIRKQLPGIGRLLSKSEEHDWDACGIGLWAQGFFE